MMRTFQVLFVVVLLVHVIYGQEDTKDKCRQKYNLDENVLADIERKDQVPEDNEAFNNYSACLMKQRQILNENGEIDWGRLTKDAIEGGEKNFGAIPGLDKTLIKPAVEEAFKICKSTLVPGSTPGQTIVRVRNCYVAQGNAIYKKIGLAI